MILIQIIHYEKNYTFNYLFYVFNVLMIEIMITLPNLTSGENLPIEVLNLIPDEIDYVIFTILYGLKL